MKVRTLTIYRESTIDWHVTGKFHCGADSEVRKAGTIPVRYTVRATCTPRLDERGFLFDQAKLGEWMTALASKPTPLSCERLTVVTANAMIAKIRKDDPECQIVTLTLTLSPSPFVASMTAELYQDGPWHGPPVRSQP